MKKITPFLFLIIIALLLSNCVGIRNITVDTREPGHIAWSPGVSSVAIVNNVVQQPDDIGHNVFPVGHSNWERSKASSDSIAIIYTEALAQFLDEEGYFNRVLYFNDPIRTDQNFFEENPLSPETMGEIMRKTGANAIISLDRLLMQTDVKGHFVTENFAYGEITARIHSLIRVYTPTAEGRIPVVHYTDSMRWEGFDSAGRLVYGENMFPTREEAMKEVVVGAAERMTNVLSPHWTTQKRWYYTSPNSRMREGIRFAQGNQWDRALEKWEMAFENARGVEKAKAANNIALAYEMSDNIEKAHEWATTANQLFEKNTSPNSLERRRSALYKAELERRLNNANRLLDITE
jgi:hypothetical protein